MEPMQRPFRSFRVQLSTEERMLFPCRCQAPVHRSCHRLRAPYAGSWRGLDAWRCSGMNPANLTRCSRAKLLLPWLFSVVKCPDSVAFRGSSDRSRDVFRGEVCREPQNEALEHPKKAAEVNTTTAMKWKGSQDPGRSTSSCIVWFSSSLSDVDES